MDNNIPIFEEQLDKYLKGRMSDSEEKKFLQLLSSNPELRQKAGSTARLAKAMQEVGSEDDRRIIKSLKAATPGKIKAAALKAAGRKAQPVITLRRCAMSLSAAASIMLCVFGTWKYGKYQQVTSLGRENLTYFPAPEYSRGTEDSVKIQLQKLYTDIEQEQDRDAAIAELSRMWEMSCSDTYNEYTEYMPEIGWMLANARLINYDKEEALTILRRLSETCPAGTAMGDKARELIKKLEEL